MFKILNLLNKQKMYFINKMEKQIIPEIVKQRYHLNALLNLFAMLHVP